MISDQEKLRAREGSLSALLDWSRALKSTDPVQLAQADELIKAAASEKPNPKAYYDLAEAIRYTHTKKYFRRHADSDEVYEIWLRRSAKHAFVDAIKSLGDRYLDSKDFKQAAEYYETAGAKGDHTAKTYLAFMMILGLGMDKDVMAGVKKLREIVKENFLAIYASEALRGGKADSVFCSMVLPSREVHKQISGSKTGWGDCKMSDLECYFTGERVFDDWIEVSNTFSQRVVMPIQNERVSLPEMKKPQNFFKAQPPEGADDALLELYGLIGIDRVKKQVEAIYNQAQFFRMRHEAGLPGHRPTMHMVFLGNPGTGKTTVARLFGKILKHASFLEKGHVVEVSARELIGQYIGSSAPMTAGKVAEAMGGILFIDEAYSLIGHTNRGGKDIGQETITTLLKLMEDYRDHFVVIVAGYTEEMKEFLESNPGLRSRFVQFITFDDYSPDELRDIFAKMAAEQGYEFDTKAREKLSQVMTEAPELFEKNFANGRYVRSIFENTIKHLACRVVAGNYKAENGSDYLRFIHAEDISAAFEESKDNTDEKKTSIGFINA